MAPRGIEYQQTGYQECRGDPGVPSDRHLDGLDMLSCVLLGSCATISVFLAVTTLHYRKKARRLKYGTKQLVEDQEREVKKELSWTYPQQQGRDRERDRGKERVSKKRPKRVRKQELVPVHHFMDMGMLGTEGDLFQDRYDEHGVLIQRRDS